MPVNESSLAVATSVVDALTRKLARQPETGLSPAESTLLTVSRFWIAAHDGELTKLLEPEPLLILIVARQAFAEIGAEHCAKLLQASISRCASHAEAADAAAAIATWLESVLLRSPDNINRLLERLLFRGSQPNNDS